MEKPAQLPPELVEKAQAFMQTPIFKKIMEVLGNEKIQGAIKNMSEVPDAAIKYFVSLILFLFLSSYIQSLLSKKCENMIQHMLANTAGFVVKLILVGLVAPYAVFRSDYIDLVTELIKVLSA